MKYGDPTQADTQGGGFPVTEIRNRTYTMGGAVADDQKRGFGNMTCPRCQEEVVIQVDLDDLGTFTCDGCDESFDAEAVKAWIDVQRQKSDRWHACLSWLKTAPKLTAPKLEE